MKLPQEPFAWDGGEDEEPIPLPGVQPLPPSPAEAVMAAAEAHVRSAQDALGRQDTQPSLFGPGGVKDEVAPSGRSGSATVRTILVVLLCAGAFAHGWSQGSALSAEARCDSDHCITERGQQRSQED